MKKRVLALVAVIAMAFAMTSCVTDAALTAVSDGTSISAANFSFPLQLTLDWRPGFMLIPKTDFVGSDVCLGIRYRF